jgi:hypothetical protein
VQFGWRRLLRRLLPRRLERAGIVDLGYLVIGEAEHLAQDLVGALAERRGLGADIGQESQRVAGASADVLIA